MKLRAPAMMPILLALGCSEPSDGASAAQGGAGYETSDFCLPDPPASAVMVDQVAGRLVDEAGTPIAELQTTVCGVQCFDGRTDADGRFAVEVGCRLVLDEYSVNPFDATFKDAADPSQLAKARLSFPNDAALVVGTPIEVLALGSYLYPEWVAPATFEVVATGSVNDDATRIELDEGLPGSRCAR